MPVWARFEHFFLDPIVALCFQHVGQLGTARLYHSAIKQNMHMVWFDVSENSLIVCDYHDAHFGSYKLVYPLCYNLDRVYVQPRVSLVEDRNFWLNDC